MKDLSLTLYLEINNLNYIFFVGENDEQKNLKIIHNSTIPSQSIQNGRILDLEKTFNAIKENVFLIEQKLKYTFKEVILILDNFDLTFQNFSGFKKLNGSQVLRENVTYILNTSKTCVDETESKKTIIHIFNSKFLLDNKKIDNLPIGLFGDFYSHELSFISMNTNDYKNLNIVFDKCRMKIKKILIKSYIEGAYLSDKNQNIETFFHIKLNENKSKIFYFENDSLKSEQTFNFGTDIIIQDISKVISLKSDVIKKFLSKTRLKEDMPDEECLEEIFFDNGNFRKIKKRLIYEIAFARIKEIFDLIIFENKNYEYYRKNSNNIFLEIDKKMLFHSFEEAFEKIVSKDRNIKFELLDNSNNENLLRAANKLVHFGWKKEAIPVAQTKKSVISRVFDLLFG